MKFNFLIKATPFLSTLLLIIVISIFNQKESTKLKILIWSTPSLTLGTYLAISTGSGFLLSYIITSNLANINQTKNQKSLKYNNHEKIEESNDYKKTNTNRFYENTLIERDIKDPSPTINASFRIIGKKERSNINFTGKYDIRKNDPIEYPENYNEMTDENETINQIKSNSNDWNDESFSKW